MSYRDDVEALTARHAALSAEVQQKTRELDSASRLLDEAKAKAKLPVLPNIRVAAPCTADWNAMTGDERQRACGQCNKNVYNLSNMTRDEAEALIIAKEGKLCVRYYQRTDGTIILKDCEVAISNRRKRRLIAAGAAALLAGGGGVAMMLRTKAKIAPAPQYPHYTMGAVAMPEPVEVKGEVAMPEPPPPPPPPIVEQVVVPDIQIKMGGIGFHDPNDPIQDL
jgi:hypothetical protein